MIKYYNYIYFIYYVYIIYRIPGGASGKELTCQCRRRERQGFEPRSGRSPRGRRGKPLQYSCWKNPLDRGAGWAIVHRVAQSWT